MIWLIRFHLLYNTQQRAEHECSFTKPLADLTLSHNEIMKRFIIMKEDNLIKFWLKWERIEEKKKR